METCVAPSVKWDMVLRDRYQVHTVRIMMRHYTNDGRFNDIPETRFVVKDEIEDRYVSTPLEEKSWAIEDADHLNAEYNIYNATIYDYLFFVRAL